MQVNLTDGRVIIVPLSAFPGIQKLSINERENWFLNSGGISVDKSNEVFHIEQRQILIASKIMEEFL